jgi:glutathione S-transferase
MTITVFGKPPTRALRVIWMLEELGLPYEARGVDFRNASKDADFMAANPAALIPAIVDGDVTMSESTAILEYLAARHGPTPLAPRPDAPNYPKYLQFLHFGEASLCGPLNVVVISRFMAPEDQKTNWGATAAADMCIRRSVLAKTQLEKTPYVAGDAFTAADISVGYGLHVMGVLGLGERLDPVLTEYLGRLQERPAFKKAVAVQ